ncbi:SDR family oxidoreductase [Jatrophihabitans cynanchi]|uniref:SDR family oxidoreductase n=1 Tax=Jatrophihabitans cynanchi TaxID=2944128 RepID=A0ABY7K0W2_9ACTN|nr:SDR family oxidoreductase [Jatrophihabitans sp. SB3-54]WAX58480.1 SDR family oxidoreductase [Jatrophihabitans sp. SB3-54]
MTIIDEVALPSFDLSGRVALVTGGGRGLGRSIALALGQAGAEVAVAARSAPQLQHTADEIAALGARAHVLPADLAAPGASDRLAASVRERCGGVDVVVHAAGIQARKPALEVGWDEWQSLMAVNVSAGFFLSTALMRTARPERLVARHVFVASLTSSIGVANTSAYAASKSAVLGVVRSLAVEWASLGVTVNAVQPGYFRTELTEAMFADPERHGWIESRIPMGRTGTGADLAGAVVFLASEAARYVTGQAIVVDGGWLAS